MQISPGDKNKNVPGSDNLLASAINLRKKITDFRKTGAQKGLSQIS